MPNLREPIILPPRPEIGPTGLVKSILELRQENLDRNKEVFQNVFSTILENKTNFEKEVISICN